MKQTAEVKQAGEERKSEPYHEPLLIKHEPLRDITGQKYNEKPAAEKFAAEATD